MPKNKDKHTGQVDERTKLIFEYLEYLERNGKRLDLCSTAVRLESIEAYLKLVDDGMGRLTD